MLVPTHCAFCVVAELQNVEALALASRSFHIRCTDVDSRWNAECCGFKNILQPSAIQRVFERSDTVYVLNLEALVVRRSVV